ncbi:hypothetical protein HDV00_003347 [Rhizophlyctis rosea]|nr:hypothetical protein HDV00_003347 [Rhizophlyctis rosea]
MPPMARLPTPDTLDTTSRYFRDSAGRTILLRGVNVSGSAKLPFKPFTPTHVKEGFLDDDHDTGVSFVGRPFPLEEADEHFGRLAHWGFNCVRLNVTWEALEHEGPGKYDEEFIEYLIKILLKAKEHGLHVFVDPHQDAWSRFTGGSGAPGWTLSAAGLNKRTLHTTNAAIVHNTCPSPSLYPPMIWPTNYHKLACATMFTLFFAGDIFAPNLKVGDIGIQTYLQSHYINAFAHLARKIVATPGLADSTVLGYDTMNEPSAGWIGLKDLSQLDPRQELKQSLTLTPFQCLLLGNGTPCTVENYKFGSMGPTRVGVEVVDPAGHRAWLGDTQCIWASHGVWDPANNKLLKKDYFFSHPSTSTAIDFTKDCWIPFIQSFTTSLRSAHPTAIIFVEPTVSEHPTSSITDIGDRIVYAPHWYDGLTLIRKHFQSWFAVDYTGWKMGKYSSLVGAVKFGKGGVVDAHASSFGLLREEGERVLGLHPTLLGETGIPFDMPASPAPEYKLQTAAMNALIDSLERSLLSFTLWNYVSDNSHQHGDGWNGEDLSLWSRDDKVIPDADRTGDFLHNDGARCLPTFCRPYPTHTNGTPISLSFSTTTKTLSYKFSHDADHPCWCVGSGSTEKEVLTEFYLPRVHYPSHGDVEVEVSQGLVEWDCERQKLWWKCSCGRDELVGVEKPVEHWIVVRRKGWEGRSGGGCCLM